MASPAVSTPSSAGSPMNLAPAPPPLAIKTNNFQQLQPHGLPTTTIITSKEWIIPPRPKPGRKPATDTPPTKRKAQNRAAQRAFRERRAARVGELEEQLEESKDEQQKRESELKVKIAKLEADVERFNGELHSWRLRCDTLDRIVEYERSEKEAALAELAYLRNGAQMKGTDAVPLPPRRNRQELSRTPIAVQQPSPAAHQDDMSVDECAGCDPMSRCACVDKALEISTQGCGKCTLDTHCQCLEDTLKATEDMGTLDLKRSHSPSNDVYSDKRQRQSESSGSLEVDFTAQFSSRPVAMSVQPQVQHLKPPGESCGFCEEGTYCMCAEAAAMAANGENDNRLAPLLNEATPPPSDTDVDGNFMKLPSLQPNQMHRPVDIPTPSNSCVNGPGSCQQCQLDPKSGLFCRSLAALRASTSTSSPSTPKDLDTNNNSGCCGGNASGSGCCKTQSQSQSKTTLPSVRPTQAPPSLSVADTYKTLSTHKGFEQASDDLSTWLGRLHSVPGEHEGRPQMEVEAASVMGVLKMFDRRFGRG